ncbi:hypothetical protein M8120_26730 [Microcystis aeruginosa str. Chao 1910]|uniref:hypothetical protein n=1 Tax=Microcystis aeruginosa TaxID=1126 RepID=UPI00224819B9|nr:hypothetical protein [Microcystis aeruginosa]UZO76233.1 hypothetical protein M8120_26730 [Microcystis aeruginosa str. Chao 1910]
MESVISYQLSVISYQLSVISYQLSVISYQLLKARGNRQKAKERIWQFSYLKIRLETKHIKAFSLIN